MPPTAALPLPIVPRALLRRHHCFVSSDTRFRAAARLLQANWRDARGLRAGTVPTRAGGHRRIGSMLAQPDAEAGSNFLHPNLARLARHEIAYRQPGALLHVRRLIANTLSSQPLTLNLFGPMKLDLKLATFVMRQLLPQADIHHVTAIHFEHSPGRNQAALTADRTAFDVAIIYRRRDDRDGFIAAEVKYSEELNGDPLPLPKGLARLNDIAEAAALYHAPVQTVLHSSDQRQLCREHLLAQAGLIRGDWTEAHFLLIAPRDNHLISAAAERYAAHLRPTLLGTVPFTFVTLEQVISVIQEAGEADHAAALHHRYTDFSIVDRLVAAEISGTVSASDSSSFPLARLAKSEYSD